METRTFEVPNIGCDGCVRTIENELKTLEGVQSVSGSSATKEVTVTFAAPVTWEAIVAKLVEIEYPPKQS